MPLNRVILIGDRGEEREGCSILNSDVDGSVPETGGRTAGEISVIFIGLLVFVN